MVENGRIARIGPASKIEVPGATVVSGKGKFLVPGFIDSHIHWYDERLLGLFSANGVTGARVMFGSPEHLAWRKRIAEGTLLGPRLRIGSPIVDGPEPVWPGSIACGDSAAGRAAVDKAKEGGYDFVKVYSLLPKDALAGIAERARQVGMGMEGHVPEDVSVAEAADYGMRAIEHLTGFIRAASRDADAIQQMPIEAFKDPATRRRTTERFLATQTRDLERKLFAKLAAGKVWQVPTLTVLRSLASLDRPSFVADPRIKYLPPSYASMWDPKADFRLKARTKEDWDLSRRVYARQRELVRGMHRAGVRIAAGTDCLNPFCFPGFSLHDEMQLLVECGLTPIQALQAATRNGAELAEWGDAGVIAVGRRADLVMLDADPTVDIRNTTKIAAVVQAGRLFDRKALDDLLATAVAISKQPEKETGAGGMCPDHP